MSCRLVCDTCEEPPLYPDKEGNYFCGVHGREQDRLLEEPARGGNRPPPLAPPPHGYGPTAPAGIPVARAYTPTASVESPDGRSFGMEAWGIFGCICLILTGIWLSFGGLGLLVSAVDPGISVSTTKDIEKWGWTILIMISTTGVWVYTGNRIPVVKTILILNLTTAIWLTIDTWVTWWVILKILVGMWGAVEMGVFN